MSSDFEYAFPRILCKSGHAAVPRSADIRDQDGLVMVSVVAVGESALGFLNELARQNISVSVELTYNAWLNEGPGNFARFADYYASSQGISCPA
ncbi:hypothetical protein BH24CHL4_BH24CHL4_13340 [soil metagenome]